MTGRDPPSEKTIFLRACELAGDERERYLDEACRGDAALRARVEKLIAQDAQDDDFFPDEPGSEEWALEQWVFHAGEKLGRFEIVRKLGRGAMGQVYEARDGKLGERVALKTLRPELVSSQEARKRFEDEILVAKTITHPNICRIHDLIEDDSAERNALCFSMEMLDGKSLSEYLHQKKRLTPQEALPLIRQMADGLTALHKKEVVHRDFKPGNVMLMKTLDSGPVAKITDFGLAQPTLPQGPPDTWVGAAKGIEGTPRYMAPEQFSTMRTEIGPAADVYAFGTVVYEMVTGEVPFESDDLFELAAKKRNETPKPPSEHVPDLDRRWETIILKCLERKPEDRPANVQQVVEELEAAEPAPRAKRRRKTLRRRNVEENLRVGAAIGAFVAILLALLWVVSRSQFTEGQPIDGVRRHVVVLPLTAVGAQTELQVLADGLMETIARRLSQFEGLNEEFLVVPASEVRRREVTTPTDALKRFGVNYAVEGSLQGQGERLRLVLTLVDAEQLRQLDTVMVNGTRANAFSLEDGAVTRLANLLNLRIQPNHVGLDRPATPSAYEFYYRGRGYLLESHKTENLENAITMFERALVDDDEYALAYAGLGEAYWRMYDRTSDPKWIDLAVDICQKAIESDDELVEVHVTLGLVNGGTGKYEQAVQNFKTALELDPRNADAYVGLARIYGEMDRPDEAIATYHTAISLRPGDWRMYHQLGLFYFGRRDYESAIGPFQRVVDYTPGSAQGFLNLGAALHGAGHVDQAQAMYERSIEIESRPFALSNLAKIHFDAERYEEAKKYLEQAVRLKPYDFSLRGELAGAYEHLSDSRAPEQYLEAAELVKQALEVNPMRQELLSEIAHYYLGAGESDQAQAWLAKATARRAEAGGYEMVVNALTCARLGRDDESFEWIAGARDRGFSEQDLKKKLKSSLWFMPLWNDPKTRLLLGEEWHE